MIPTRNLCTPEIKLSNFQWMNDRMSVDPLNWQNQLIIFAKFKGLKGPTILDAA